MSKMLGLMIVAVAATLASAPAGAGQYPAYIRSHYPKAIQPLLLRQSSLDEDCRGLPDGSAAARKACGQRDALTRQLKVKGWCWGSKNPDAYDADLTWLLCRDDRTGA